MRLDRIAQVDERNAISATVKAIDEEHAISERAQHAANQAAAAAQLAGEAISSGAERLSARARADPNVGPALVEFESGWASVRSWATQQHASAQATWREALARAGGEEPATPRNAAARGV